MSDLVGNPDDRFSHNEAQLLLDRLRLYSNKSTLKPKTDFELRDSQPLASSNCLRQYLKELKPEARGEK